MVNSAPRTTWVGHVVLKQDTLESGRSYKVIFDTSITEHVGCVIVSGGLLGLSESLLQPSLRFSNYSRAFTGLNDCLSMISSFFKPGEALPL
jgi:hypothetical protein